MQDRARRSSSEPSPAGPTKGGLIGLLEQAWPPAQWRDVRVAIAVSGGPDSVALLLALAEGKRLTGGRGDLTVVHFDHAVRGEASRADAQWVAQLADRLGLACHSETAAVVGERSEESLRDERRAYYRRAADILGARYLATGHQADDQAETLIFRLLRGTGARGAAGIRPTARLTPACTLVRPLLGATRGAILDFLQSRGQDYRTDATNADPTASTRNWLRHEVLPQLSERFPRATANLAAYAAQSAATAELVDSLAAGLLSRARMPAPALELRIAAGLLAEAPPLLAIEALRLAWRAQGWPEKGMNACHWRGLLAILYNGAAASFPGNLHARLENDQLAISPGAAHDGSC